MYFFSISTTLPIRLSSSFDSLFFFIFPHPTFFSGPSFSCSSFLLLIAAAVAIVPSRYPLSLSLIAGSLSASVWIICFSFSDILFSFLRLFCCYVSIVCGFETFVNTFLWLFDFLLLCHIFYCFSSLYAV